MNLESRNRLLNVPAQCPQFSILTICFLFVLVSNTSALSPFEIAVRSNSTRSQASAEDAQKLTEDWAKSEAETYQPNPNAGDYYERLGIPKSSDLDAIRKAFRKSVRLYHPDLWGNLSVEERTKKEEFFKAVGEAYEVLSDSEKRERYDKFGRSGVLHRSRAAENYMSVDALIDVILSFGNPYGVANFIYQHAPALKSNPQFMARVTRLALDSQLERANAFNAVIRHSAIDVLVAHLKSETELIGTLGRIIQDHTQNSPAIRTYAILALRERASHPAVASFLMSVYNTGSANSMFWASPHSFSLFHDAGIKEVTAAALEALGKAAANQNVRDTIFAAAENSYFNHPAEIQVAAAKALPEVLRLVPEELPRLLRLIQTQQYSYGETSILVLPHLFRSLANVSKNAEMQGRLDELWEFALRLLKPLPSLLALLEVAPQLIVRHPTSLFTLNAQFALLWKIPPHELVAFARKLATTAHEAASWILLSALYAHRSVIPNPVFRHELDSILSALAADPIHRKIYLGLARSDYSSWNNAFITKIDCVAGLAGLAGH